MELTKREQQLAKRCVSWSKSFLIKYATVISFFGVILFGLDIFPVPLPEWLRTICFTLGVLMILDGIFSDFIRIIAKLYQNHKESENKHEIK